MSAAGTADDLAPLLRWVVDQPEHTIVDLVCAHHAEQVAGSVADIVVRLPGCAAELPTVALLEVVAAGASVLTVRTDGCPAADRVVRTVAEAAQFLTACEHSSRVVAHQGDATGQPTTPHDMRHLPMSRRRMFFLSAGSRPLPDNSANSRTRMLAALSALTSGRDPNMLPLRDLPASSAVLCATDCTACGVCTRACPTSALQLHFTTSDAGEQTFSLVQSSTRCLDCSSCVMLCPANALRRLGQTGWAYLLSGTAALVAEGAARRCTRCGNAFAGNGTAECCPVCEFRRANPFGFRIPVGSR